MSVSFVLGSDPECMLIDEHGNLVSAIPIIPGDKDNPTPIRNGSMQHDNVNVEYGITPAKNEEEWVLFNGDVIKQISDFIKPRGLKLLARASANFPDSALEDPLARQFGCSPDFDPYDICPNSIDGEAAKSNFRTAGGHIHIGASDVAGDFQATLDVAKAMDVFVGIPSLLLDKDETSQARRSLYGKAGCHRPKPYGVEYRAAGNFWCSHPDLTRLMWRLSSDAMRAWRSNLLVDIDENSIRSTINDGNLESAILIMEGLVIPLLSETSKSLLDKCLAMTPVDINEGWNL